MTWYDEDSEHARAHQQVHSAHKAQLSHELIAAAASFEAAKAYQNHCAENGQPASHETAKNLLAAFSGAFIDRMIETKGLDFIDAHKAKQHAKEEAESRLAASGQYSQY